MSLVSDTLSATLPCPLGMTGKRVARRPSGRIKLGFVRFLAHGSMLTPSADARFWPKSRHR